MFYKYRSSQQVQICTMGTKLMQPCSDLIQIAALSQNNINFLKIENWKEIIQHVNLHLVGLPQKTVSDHARMGLDEGVHQDTNDSSEEVKRI